MGTTVTTHLGLIKPDTSESIKEDLPTFAGWAAQNEDNCDVIDGLFRHSEHTWTPSLTATGSNPTLGSGGSTEGKYVRLFPQMTLCFFRVFMGGAGFAGGSGTYNLTLPVTPADEFGDFFDSVPIGKAYLLDNDSALNSSVAGVYYSVGGGTLFMRPPGGASVTNSAPFTWAQNDRISGFALLPTGDA